MDSVQTHRGFSPQRAEQFWFPLILHHTGTRATAFAQVVRVLGV